MTPLLEINDLRVYFDTPRGVVKAVDGVSFKVAPGETLAVVGESGCGKSVTCHSILRLHPSNGRIVAGSISFQQVDLRSLDIPSLESYRGKEIAMIFQDPMTALNPVHTIGGQIAESIMLHRGMNRRDAFGAALRFLEIVGIPEAKRRLTEYPHQLSGGMNQRAMIAMALSCHPKLLIADEPTTALDVTIQAQILELMRQLQREQGMAIILITHDLGVVAEMADNVAVMYSGKIVEQANVEDIFQRPAHPYTVALLESLPRIDRDLDKLRVIEGSVPSPFELPRGCHFTPRCHFATEECRRRSPALEPLEANHQAACLHPQGIAP